VVADIKTAVKLGIGFRPELALMIERRAERGALHFVEILAEDYKRPQDIPQALKNLRKKGLEIIVHSTSLSLGQAEQKGTSGQKEYEKCLRKRARHLNEIALLVDSPFVSDHIAFVRSGNLESGHLLPVEHSAAMQAVLRRNIAIAREMLQVPLVLENIACTFDLPGAEMDEASFVAGVVEENDCGLLLDLSNLFANAHNLNFSAAEYLEELPLQRLAYVHLAGGTFKRGLYHDTHSHPLQEQSLFLLEELIKHMPTNMSVSRVMLERDDRFPPEDELNGELDAIAAVLAKTEVASACAKIEAGNRIAGQSKLSTAAAQSAVADVALCVRQEELVKSLLGMAAVPHWLHEKRIREAAEALSRKRLRTIKRAHPALDKHLPPDSGTGVFNLFEVDTDDEKRLDHSLRLYFAAFPSVHPDGCYADSLAFLKFIKTAQKQKAESIYASAICFPTNEVKV